MKIGGNVILKGIGVILLIFATFQLPYGYYIFLRISITFIAAYLTYNLYKEDKTVWAIIFLLIGILFNPIFPIYLDKETWVILDIGTAVIFFISLITNLKLNGNKTD